MAHQIRHSDIRYRDAIIAMVVSHSLALVVAGQDQPPNDNAPSAEERKRRASILREADEARARYFLARKCTECKGTGSISRTVKSGSGTDRVRSVCSQCNGRKTKITQTTLEAFDDYSVVLGQLDMNTLAETRHFAFIDEAWELLHDHGGEAWAPGVTRTPVREVRSQAIFISGRCGEVFGTKSPFVVIQNTPYGNALVPLPPDANWKTGEDIQVLCYVKRCVAEHDELANRNAPAHLDVTRILKWSYRR